MVRVWYTKGGTNKHSDRLMLSKPYINAPMLKYRQHRTMSWWSIIVRQMLSSDMKGSADARVTDGIGYE